MELKDKVKKYREENKLTQLELANKLKISRGYLADIEHGRIKGNIKLINKLADVTDKSLSYWASDSEIEIHQYETLDTLIDILIEQGLIKEGQKLDEPTSKILIGMLEKEIALKFERMNK